MGDITYLSGLFAIILLVGAEKYCEMYGHPSVFKYIKMAFPIAGIAGVGVAMWVQAQ